MVTRFKVMQGLKFYELVNLAKSSRLTVMQKFGKI